MTISSYKREIFYRKAQGRSLFVRLKEKVNFLLGLQADETLFLSLPETDNIIRELKKKRQIFCELIEFSSVTECFKFIFSQIEDRKYYLLIDEDWKYCGAYKIENDFSFSAEFDFDKSKSDEIRLISIDFSAQISIDYSESCGEKNFEVRIRKYG